MSGREKCLCDTLLEFVGMLRTGTSAWNSRILPFRTDKAQGQGADRAPHSMGHKSQQPPWWYQVSLACPSKELPKSPAATMHGRLLSTLACAMQAS